MFKYGKGSYVMLLSAADLGEPIKQHERERERERMRERGVMMVYW